MRVWFRCLGALATALSVRAGMAETLPGAVSEEERLRVFFADSVLDGLEGRDWLLTDGYLDATLARRATERGLRLTLLTTQASPGEAPVWREDVRALGNDDLYLFSELGPVTFARVWLRAAPEQAARRLATLSLPDLWLVAGRPALPNGAVFLGGTPDAPELDARLARHRAWWDDLGEQLVIAGISSPTQAEVRLRLRRQASLAANNLGSLLERAGRLPEAFEVYTRARILDPQNVSALLNRAVAVKRGIRPELAEQVGRELEGLRETLPDPRLLWNLTQAFGVVEHPEEFVALGWPWALSGISVAETNRWQTLLESVPAEQREAVRRQLAATHAGQTGATDGDVSLWDAFQDPARRGEACLEISRRFLALDRREAAEGWLDRAAAAGAAAQTVLLERLGQWTAQGRLAEARERIATELKTQPENWQLWSLLTAVLAEQRAVTELEAAVRTLAALPDAEPFAVLVATGRLHAMKGQAWPAREAYLRALEARPEAILLYDLILPLDFALADKRAAERHAKALLRVAPQHAFANYIKGAVLLERMDYAAAEVYLQRSVQTAPTVYALNDYAVLLLATRRPEEAERTVRAALTLDAGSAAAWNTLATALAALGRADAAFDALAKAVALEGGDDPRIQLHWAQTLHRRGDTERARAAAEKAHAGRTQLGPTERDALLKLRDALR